MLPPKNSDSPVEHSPLRINLIRDKIGWRKYKPLFWAISSKVLIGILFVICSPFLPIVGLLYLLNLYQKYKQKKAVKKGVLTSEILVFQKTTVYLDGNDVYGFLGISNIEFSQNAKKASFNYGGENGRYIVYGTYEEGLFMLVPAHSKIHPEKSSYYQCEVVRVNGGYNHGNFGEKSPMGSNDCIVLVCKKASKIPPSKDLIVITTSEATEAMRRHYSSDMVER